MATPRSMSDISLHGEKTLPDKFNPCITDTFLDVPSAEIVVVPWKVFQIFPEIMHQNFRSENGWITYDGDVNIFMSNSNLQPSKYGHLEEFTQTWVVPISSPEELDAMTVRLSSFPSLLSVTLTARNILEDSIEIPMVIFLSPESQCIRDLVSKLGQTKDSFHAGKKFSVEVDIGPSMAKWGKKVLRREFLSVGGRFVMTSGAVFNHVFDWSNVLGCVPCLPCGIIGSSVYRLHRKINYRDVILSDMVGIAILGAKGMAFSNQRHAVYLLMQWIRVFNMYYCIDCRKRVPLNESQKTKRSFCSCDNSSTSFVMRNRMSSVNAINSDRDTGKALDGEMSEQSDSGRPSSPNSAEIALENVENDKIDNQTGNQTGEDESHGSSLDSMEDTDQGQATARGLAGRSPRYKTNNSKSKRRSPAKKKDDKVLDDKGGKFAPYKEGVSGTVIERKKWMVSQNPSVTKPEWKSSMNVLNTKKPGGFVKVRTMFRYPAQGKNRKPGRRPNSSGFVEIELKRTDGEDNMQYNMQADAETSEITLPQEEANIGKHGYIDDVEEEEEEETEQDFYIMEEEEDLQFDSDPLGRTDLKRFLGQISDPKTGTLNASFNDSEDRPVTKQPGVTESMA